MSICKALIPLDGTKLSEESSLVIPFLRTMGVTKVHLVSVCEEVPGPRAPEGEYREALQKGEAAAGAYLRAKIKQLEGE